MAPRKAFSRTACPEPEREDGAQDERVRVALLRARIALHEPDESHDQERRWLIVLSGDSVDSFIGTNQLIVLSDRSPASSPGGH